MRRVCKLYSHLLSVYSNTHNVKVSEASLFTLLLWVEDIPHFFVWVVLDEVVECSHNLVLLSSYVGRCVHVNGLSKEVYGWGLTAFSLLDSTSAYVESNPTVWVCSYVLTTLVDCDTSKRHVVLEHSLERVNPCVCLKSELTHCVSCVLSNGLNLFCDLIVSLQLS